MNEFVNQGAKIIFNVSVFLTGERERFFLTGERESKQHRSAVSSSPAPSSPSGALHQISTLSVGGSHMQIEKGVQVGVFEKAY